MRLERAPLVGAKSTLAMAAITIAFWASPAAAECFRYGDVVTLTGAHLTLAAPPDDGVIRDPRHDAARRADLLVLDTPLCVNADVLSQGVSAATSIQLHCPMIDVADGSVISVTGRLLGAATGNGQTPVLLSCQT